MQNYSAVNSVPLAAAPTISDVVQKFVANATNTGAATYSPDGLSPAPILGLGGQPLQGNEIVENGIVTLVSYVGSQLNSGALCWVLYECAGGAQQVAPATQSQHAVQLGQVIPMAPVVGDSRNVQAYLATSSSSITYTGLQIVVQDASARSFLVKNFTVSVDLTAPNGIGGLDTGTHTAKVPVAVYLMYNLGTGEAGLMGQVATALMPETYQGSAQPAGYTMSALIGVNYATEAQFTPQLVTGRRVSIEPTDQLVSGEIVSNQQFLIGAPFNAKTVSFSMNINNNAQANMALTISPTPLPKPGIGAVTCTTDGSGALAANMQAKDMPLLTPSTIFFTTSNSGPQTNFEFSFALLDFVF